MTANTVNQVSYKYVCLYMLAFFLLLCGCSTKSAEQSPNIEHIDFRSEILDKEMQLKVYMPRGYSDFLYPSESVRIERDPVYIVKEGNIKELTLFLDVEIGGSTGVKHLYDVAIANGVDAEYHYCP